MNITFLIGNGFDLGLGLKTSFKDYYDICKVRQINEEESEELEENIRKDIELWSNFEEGLGKYTDKFTLDTKEVFFERKDQFEEGFYDYLSSEEKRLQYDKKVITKTMKDALLHFYDRGVLTPDDEQGIKCIIDSNNDYVFNFINFNYTKTLENCLEPFSDKIIEKRQKNSTMEIWKINEVIHVHGIKYKNPIIGVDNPTQISNKEFANDQDFLKRFIKPQINQYLGMQFASKSKKIIDNSQIICIYGMSIGATDATWWRYLAEWLKNNTRRYLIIFWFDEDFKSYLPEKTIKKKDDIKNKFLKYSTFSDSIKNSLSRRIYIAINQTIFKMKLTVNTTNQYSEINPPDIDSI